MSDRKVTPQPPFEASQPLALLRHRLQQLRRQAGEPSTRHLAQRIRSLSHTTVNTVLHCAKTPRWGPLELVVEALDGDVEEFKELWMAVRAADDDQRETANFETMLAEAHRTAALLLDAARQEREAVMDEVRRLLADATALMRAAQTLHHNAGTPHDMARQLPADETLRHAVGPVLTSRLRPETDAVH